MENPILRLINFIKTQQNFAKAFHFSLHSTIVLSWNWTKAYHITCISPHHQSAPSYEAAQAVPGAAGAGLAAPRDAQLRPHHLRPHAQRQAQGVPAANTDYGP